LFIYFLLVIENYFIAVFPRLSSFSSKHFLISHFVATKEHFSISLNIEKSKIFISKCFFCFGVYGEITADKNQQVYFWIAFNYVEGGNGCLWLEIQPWTNKFSS